MGCHSHSNHEKCSCPCHAKDRCHDGEKNHDEEGHDGFGHALLEAADAAWMEVLKDKIKEHLLATQNDKMTELAKIVAETNSQKWRNKMERKHGCCDFKEKLSRFFGHKK